MSTHQTRADQEHGEEREEMAGPGESPHIRKPVTLPAQSEQQFFNVKKYRCWITGNGSAKWINTTSNHLTQKKQEKCSA